MDFIASHSVVRMITAAARCVASTVSQNAASWSIVARGAAHTVYETLVVHPLYRLYRNGPSLHGLAFWSGIDDATLCAHLTRYDANFWSAHADECARVIERDFAAHMVAVETVLYFVVLAQVVWALSSLPCRAVKFYARWKLCTGDLERRRHVSLDDAR